MRISSIVAGAVTVALASTAFVGAPANAVTENRTTSVTIESSYKQVEHGKKFWISAAVKDNVGETVYTNGTVTLFQKVKGSDWKAIQTSDRSGGFVLFDDIKPSEHTTYRATFSGWTATSQYENNYAPSTSGEVKVKVARKITGKKVKGKKFTVKGKVTPNFKKKKLVIKVAKKRNGKYKTYTTVRTNKKGVYKVSFPRTRGTRYYKIIAPADSRYSKNYVGWWTSVY